MVGGRSPLNVFAGRASVVESIAYRFGLVHYRFTFERFSLHPEDVLWIWGRVQSSSNSGTKNQSAEENEQAEPHKPVV